MSLSHSLSRVNAHARRIVAQGASTVETLGKRFEEADKRLADVEYDLSSLKDDLETAVEDLISAQQLVEELRGDIEKKHAEFTAMADGVDAIHDEYIEQFDAALDAGEEDLYDAEVYSDHTNER